MKLREQRGGPATKGYWGAQRARAALEKQDEPWAGAWGLPGTRRETRTGKVLTARPRTTGDLFSQQAGRAATHSRLRLPDRCTPTARLGHMTALWLLAGSAGLPVRFSAGRWRAAHSLRASRCGPSGAALGVRLQDASVSEGPRPRVQLRPVLH